MSSSTLAEAGTPRRDGSRWSPGDEAFWQSQGRRLAQRNQWISIPSLLCAFSIWSCWSIIAAQMKNLGLAFSSQHRELVVHRARQGGGEMPREDR